MMGRTTEGVQGWRKRESHGNRQRQEAGQKDRVGKKQETQRKRNGKERERGRETDSCVTADFDEALFHQIPVTSYSCPRRGPIVTRVSQPAALVVVLIAPPHPVLKSSPALCHQTEDDFASGSTHLSAPPPLSHNCTRQVFVNRLSVGAQRDLRKGNKHAIKGTKPHKP